MQSYYRIALDDLLGRDLTVQWFEGVAIVQGVCRQLLADASSERGFPSLAGVYVCANGAIELDGAASASASASQSVAAAGHALTQMLGENAPVRLRLVATQATAGDVGYQTLQEFSDAVAYFERPDPEGILRALHNRAWDAELGGEIPQEVVQTVQPQAQSQEASAQKPTPEAQTSAPPKPEKNGRRKWLVPAGIAGSLLCIALWRLPLGSQATATSVVATVQNAVRSTLARVAPAAEAQKADEKPDTAVASHPPVKRAMRRSPVQNRGNTTDNRASRSVSTLPAAMPPLLPIAPLATTAWSRPDVSGELEGEQPPAVYTALNAEVVPPKSVYPKLPAAPPSGFSVPGQTVLEMVIGTNGLVERVKLRTEPRNIHEFMLVSAAKAWQFEPARLHGIPVRYLHTVILTLQ